MGLLEDILSDPGIREAMAGQELEKAGSVMAKEKDTSSPLMGTINDLLKLLNPVEWMGGVGGGSGAILGPIRTAAQKQIAKTLAMDAPELLKEAVASKRMLNITSPTKWAEELKSKYPEFYKNYGIYQEALNPSFGGTISLAPTTLRGKAPSGAKAEPTLSEVAIHELTHFLTGPQTRALTPQEGMESATSLQKYLKAHGSDMVANELFLGETERAASEALSYLSEQLGKGGKSEEIFKALRPILPTPPAGAKGTFGGISGMGVENRPLYKTLVELGLIEPAKSNVWSELISRLGVK